MLFGATLCLSQSVFSQKIVTIVSPTGNQAIFQTLEDDINSNLPDVNASEYLNTMANASAFSAAGLGVDYSDTFSLFMVGVHLGIGADTNDGFKGLTDEPDPQDIKGVGANATVTVGLNLKILPFNIGPINTDLSLIHISEPTRRTPISYAVFCLKKKK